MGVRTGGWDEAALCPRFPSQSRDFPTSAAQAGDMFYNSLRSIF